MALKTIACLAALALSVSASVHAGPAQSNPPIPDVRQLMREVQDHQKKLEQEREAYTYSSAETVQTIDANGKVTRTETSDNESFFVHGHLIERTIRKNGQPLNPHDEEKETERVTRLVEKAEKTPSDQELEGPTVSISRVLDLMDVTNPRRENWRGRPALGVDFTGRKNAKTHGLAEDASKKLKGTLWVDEADREVAHLEVMFDDNFHVAGGLVANVQKGSNFRFDQAPVDGQLWLPTGGEGNIQVRVLLVKNMRQHFAERDFDYKKFRVDTQSAKDARVVPAEKH